MNNLFCFDELIDDADFRFVSTVKQFTVKATLRKNIASFIEKWHYSHNVNGVTDTYCFGLYAGDVLIGGAMLGNPATPGVAESYSDNKLLRVIELRRLCCIDKTPKNTESYFIGQIMKWLKQHSDIDVVLSYSDMTYGHEGTIYKASNFTLVGQSPCISKIMHNGKLYHDKSLRVYNGAKKDGAKQKPFSIKLCEALSSGEAVRVMTKPKNIYLYRIKRNHRNNRIQVATEQEIATQPRLL